MSDSKKRAHESNGDHASEGDPQAKRVKTAEHDTTNPSPNNSHSPQSGSPSPSPDSHTNGIHHFTPTFASSTHPGSRYGPLNQDCHFIERFQTPQGHFVTVTAVFDGHGKHGETASALACDYFKEHLRTHLTQTHAFTTREHEKAIKGIFEGAHRRILAEYDKLTTLKFDGYTFELTMTPDRVEYYQCAACPYVLLQDFGTTVVLCIYWEETQKMMVANCGDSDALIGRWDALSATIQPSLLTISDNVSSTTNGEQERIRKQVGRKTKFGGGYLSPNDSTYGFHSLAMTRALGHKFLERYGVTWDPHIRLFQITAEDMVLVVASDGLFDVVNSKAILSVAAEKQTIDTPDGPVLRVLTPQESSVRLVNLALENWKKQFNSDDVADNTTVCVVKLSDDFDKKVAERKELVNSGTAFSPATSTHAFEPEIEEGPKDLLASNAEATPTSQTPVLEIDRDAPTPVVPAIVITSSESEEPSLLQALTARLDPSPPPIIAALETTEDHAPATDIQGFEMLLSQEQEDIHMQVDFLGEQGASIPQEAPEVASEGQSGRNEPAPPYIPLHVPQLPSTPPLEPQEIASTSTDPMKMAASVTSAAQGGEQPPSA